MQETEETKRTSVVDSYSMTPERQNWIKDQCKKQGLTKSEFFRRMMDAYGYKHDDPVQSQAA